MNKSELIKKLRQLKKQELTIRFSFKKYTDYDHLIWSEFFSTDSININVCYPLNEILNMNHNERKEAFSCFFYAVQHQYYKENGLPITKLFEIDQLEILGLPPTASEEQIKAKFKALAKLHHPDKGGNQSIFVEILNAYERLKNDF